MSTLLVQTLVNELRQDIRISGEERKHIGCISPYIYAHNPSGTFTLGVYSGATLLAEKSFTMTDIKTSLDTTNNYAHVFYPVIFDEPLKLEKGDYSLVLSATDYSSTAASFIGWAQQFEDIQNEMDYLPLSDEQNSLAFRVKILKEGIL